MGAKRDESFWVLRAQAGDREALELMFEALAPVLKRYLARIAPSHADDLLQDVLVIVYRKLGYLRDPELLRPWAFRIASREALRLLRKERGRGHADDPALVDRLAAEPDSHPDIALDAEGILDAVPPASRAAMVLHYLHELSFVDVASILEIPIGTVKSRINYGLGLLRRAKA
ncbi:MAG: RNA polymerase sigma factor [Acidobacteriota bacterium]